MTPEDFSEAASLLREEGFRFGSIDSIFINDSENEFICKIDMSLTNFHFTFNEKKEFLDEISFMGKSGRKFIQKLIDHNYDYKLIATSTLNPGYKCNIKVSPIQLNSAIHKFTVDDGITINSTYTTYVLYHLGVNENETKD